MSYHTCERCGTHSSIFWHTLGYGVSEIGDGAIKIFEFCDKCLFDLIQFMKEYETKEYNAKENDTKEVDE